MATEKVIPLALQLFDGEKWLENRRRGREEGEIFDEMELKVCGAIVNLPEFASLSSEGQKSALKFGLTLLDNVSASMKGSQFRRERLEREMALTLETAENIGVGLTMEVFKTAIGAAEEAWRLR